VFRKLGNLRRVAADGPCAVAPTECAGCALPDMSTALQPTRTTEDEDGADQSKSEDVDDVPIYIRKFMKLLQEAIGSDDGEETSAAKRATAPWPGVHEDHSRDDRSSRITDLHWSQLIV
jgi:hypothetical protein